MATNIDLGEKEYLSTFILGGTAPVKNGSFVVLDIATETAVPADATTGDGDVYLVDNIIDTVKEEMIDDIDYVVKPGELLRLKKLKVGDVFTTTEFNKTGTGASATISVKGDKLAVGVGGNIEAIGTRTPKQSYSVLDNSDCWTYPALQVVVNA